MKNTFQAPKGTRDFMPEAMAVRRYIEETWRRVSVRHGFLEVDGPTFESLELYKVKSGDEIVSQLFSFRDRGDRELALRPEFTPTLARMVAAQAQGLPRPIKWFSIPRCYRAEQPQKGRLREFIQWNVDFLADPSPRCEQECLMLCIETLREFGLQAGDFRIGWNNRDWLTQALTSTFVAPERVGDAYFILDRLAKLDAAGRRELYAQRQCPPQEQSQFDLFAAAISSEPAAPDALMQIMSTWPQEVRDGIKAFESRLADIGLGEYCRFDLSVVRGLAYYTGFVFEVLDAKSHNRAMAGGGRYDRLIETFGGPSMPAIGFGMGDVVLEIVLRERGVLPRQLLSTPDVFVLSALPDEQPVQQILMALRRSTWDSATQRVSQAGLHAVASYKATRNIGKLLPEAVASGARVAVILAPEELARGVAKIKNLITRTEREAPLEAAALAAQVRAELQSG